MDPTEETLNDPGNTGYLHRLVGDEGLDLLERFPKEGEHSDEDLAASTGINFNSYGTRSIPFTRSGSPNTTGSRTTRPAGSPTSGNSGPTGSMMRSGRTWESFLRNSPAGNDSKRRTTSISARTATSSSRSPCNEQRFPVPDCDKPLGHFDNEMLLKSLKSG